jgi:hypothetical protein
VFGRIGVFQRGQRVGLNFVFDLIEGHPLDKLRGGHLPFKGVDIPDAQVAGELEQEITL